MRNLALTSGVLSTLMSPPCASTTSLMIFVPNPVPRGVLLRMAGVKRRVCVSRSMLQPVSATSIDGKSPSGIPHWARPR